MNSAINSWEIFEGDATMHPLINLWPLSVEEQFYIFIPLLAWRIWKKFRKGLPCILLGDSHAEALRIGLDCICARHGDAALDIEKNMTYLRHQRNKLVS